MTRIPADIVLSGGSTKGPVHAGFMSAVAVFWEPKRFACNSAGTLYGAMYASGRSQEEIVQITMETDFHRVSDVDLRFARLAKAWNRGYLTDGAAFDAFLQGLFGPATLGDLQIPLWAAVFNITKDRLEFWSSEGHPEMPVWKAVRASTCIPMVFRAVEHEGDLFVDGGVAADFPLQAFAPGCKVKVPGQPARNYSRPIVACLISPHHEPPRQRMRLTRWLDEMLSSIVRANTNRSEQHAPEGTVIARPTGLGLSMLDFRVPAETKRLLIDEGEAAGLEAAGTLRRMRLRRIGR